MSEPKDRTLTKRELAAAMVEGDPPLTLEDLAAVRLLYHLRALFEAGELRGVPVIVDGPMGLDVAALYERHHDCYDDAAEALLRVGQAPLSFEALFGARGLRGSEAARGIEGPATVIVGSGMCWA